MELDIFNENPGALIGVNERIPQLKEFLKALEINRSKVDPHLFTHSAWGIAKTETVPGIDLKYFRSWQNDMDREIVSASSGSIALKVQLNAPLGRDARVQKSGILKPSQFARWLETQPQAMARLGDWIPSRFVNMQFQDSESNRFLLVKGWQKKEKKSPFRQAYRRCRWYFSRDHEQESLEVELMVPDFGFGPEALLKIRVDAVEVVCERIVRGVWTRYRIPIVSIPVGRKFAAELQIITGERAFNDALLRVRRFELAGEGTAAPFSEQDIEHAGFDALL
jgi:hypothetical protein